MLCVVCSTLDEVSGTGSLVFKPHSPAGGWTRWLKHVEPQSRWIERRLKLLKSNAHALEPLSSRPLETPFFTCCFLTVHWEPY